ncbi:kinase-like domain-containing protein [Mycena filopes]|nr:kinase-like domain-containing protein [Mycena filopes]
MSLEGRPTIFTSFVVKAQMAYGRWKYPRKHWSITRISPTRLVKVSETLTEALNLQYIAANTTIPVPRVHQTIRNRSGGMYIIMDAVEGTNLEAVWDDLSLDDRLSIMHQLRGYITQLRELEPPHPGAVEAVNGTACNDIRVAGDGFGPFSSVAEFHTFLAWDWFMENKITAGEYQEFAPAIRRCAARSEPYRTVFAHCDLAPRNILVKGTKIVAIVDWEMAGWYPEYWEYTRAFFSNLENPAGFWELFEEEANPERYPDELITERCVGTAHIRG